MSQICSQWVHVVTKSAESLWTGGELTSIRLEPRIAGRVVLGPVDVVLRAERDSIRSGRPGAPGLILDASVWDDGGYLHWYGDLDVPTRAGELQRLADLIGSEVYVTHRACGPLYEGRSKAWRRTQAAWTFDPIGGAPHPLARLSRLNLRHLVGRGRVSEPVQWLPERRTGTPVCVLDFSPGRRRMLQHVVPTSSSDPLIASVLHDLRVQVLGAIADDARKFSSGLRALSRMLDSYLATALGPAVTGAWDPDGDPNDRWTCRRAVHVPSLRPVRPARPSHARRV